MVPQALSQRPSCSSVRRLHALSLLGLLLGCATSPLSAQIAGESPAVREPIRPRLLASIPVGRIRYYELQEQTRITRQLPDGTTQTVEREVTSVLRFYAFTAREHGMTELACRVEELTYRFRHDTVSVTFSSRQPERLPRRLPDLEFVSSVLGTELEILLSPYGDIARIGGEQLEWLRKYLRSQVGSDSLRLAARLSAISEARWASLFDLHKGIVPGTRMREDSTWHRLVTLWIEGAQWRDTAHTHIAKTSDTTRTLVGVLPALRPRDSTVWLPDLFPTPATLTHGRGHAQITVELAPHGLTLSSTLHAYTEAELAPANRVPFRQTTQVTYTWRFLREE